MPQDRYIYLFLSVLLLKLLKHKAMFLRMSLLVGLGFSQNLLEIEHIEIGEGTATWYDRNTGKSSEKCYNTRLIV